MEGCYQTRNRYSAGGNGGDQVPVEQTYDRVVVVRRGTALILSELVEEAR